MITQVRIRLVADKADCRKAFCSIILGDALVVHNIRIIAGTRGLFISMPERTLMDSCLRCHGQNPLRARYCNGCGRKLASRRVVRGDDGREKYFSELVHPIPSPPPVPF